MPAMYRDIDMRGDGRISEVPPINYIYSQILSTAPPTLSGSGA
jgi:hypothetical protein